MGKTRGFTLIELMVTIAVMAVIAMMAAPTFTSLIRKNQLNTNARDFENKLKETRSNALLRQKTQNLSIDANDAEAWRPNTEIEWNSTLSSSVNKITYNMLGLLDSTTNLCFVLQHKKDTAFKAVIIVRRTGLVIYDKSRTDCSNLGTD